jgi:hypothetical protein
VLAVDPIYARAMKMAWAEYRQANRIAALTPQVKADRLESLHSLIERAGYIDSGMESYHAEIRQLQAA